MSRQKCSTNFSFTLFNYEDVHVAQLKTLDTDVVKYIVFGYEICPDTKRPHLQGYLNLKKEKTLSALKRIININHIHLEISRKDSLANYDYCTKDGKFEEVGDRPVTPREKGETEKQRWQDARTHAKEGNLGEFTPIYLPGGVWAHIMSYADDRKLLIKECETRARNWNDLIKEMDHLIEVIDIRDSYINNLQLSIRSYANLLNAIY